MTVLDTSLGELTEIQRQAVNWDRGSLLVLAGPGSGKTQVLTCRIARILETSRGQNFRVLALTFTNKAADEMRTRVGNFVPGLEERANIATFHGFCGQVLRQHGVHLGINPDFTIYSSDDDRKAILEDALRRAQALGRDVSAEDVRFLPIIDQLKSRLIPLGEAEKALRRANEPERALTAYEVYEEELRRINALDFNSLILETFNLVNTYPGIAMRYKRSYPYWLIDEFQDTNTAQYKVVRTFAGEDFCNVFAVADDDQIIYEWNGASYRQIQAFLNDFSAQAIQLPTNFRCPPAIVEAANRLVVYNAQRASSKEPLVAAKTTLKYQPEQHLQLRFFKDQDDEARQIAQEIAAGGRAIWGSSAVLARMRSLLEGVYQALQELNVPTVIAQRRDEFLSPQFRWLSAALRQIVRPLDRRNFALLVQAFNRFTNATVSADQLVAEGESTGRAYLSVWMSTTSEQQTLSESTRTLLRLLESISSQPQTIRTTLDQITSEFEKQLGDDENASDLQEDLSAWQDLARAISAHIGRNAPLDQFLQELQLRSKEPSPRDDTVQLMTVHAAKGREFDSVYVIGLAEDVMPSYQSRQKGDRSPEMEEERRNCFVAITRTKERLVLSRAATYRGWRKAPSRFLVEMGLVKGEVAN